MQLIPIDRLPGRKANCRYKNLRHFINNFMRMNEKYVRLDYASSEFTNVYSAKVSFNRMIRLYNYPMQAVVINSELYLIRTDMED